jgi:hypothetical protein
VQQLGADPLDATRAFARDRVDAVISHREIRKTIALFRCTQMILYAKPGS